MTLLAGEQPEQTVVFSQFTSFLDIAGPKVGCCTFK
jgi:hypothetical protein